MTRFYFLEDLRTCSSETFGEQADEVMVKFTFFVFILLCVGPETDILANDDISNRPVPLARQLASSSSSPAINPYAKRLKIVGTKLSRVNAILGIYSRSKSVKTLSLSLREENNAQVQESLNQALATLLVLDVGAGVVLPVAKHIIKSIATEKDFSATRNSLEKFSASSASLIDQLDDVDETAIKSRLKLMKKKVFVVFKKDVRQISNVATLKYLHKAKKWFNLKSAGQVLGPIFDIACVGINSWALHTTVRDCQETPETCNYGAIASASLSIAGGFVGLTTFFLALKFSSVFLGPAGAVVAALFGITATLIEIYYVPPAVLKAREDALKEHSMKYLDVYAKLQLFKSNRILIDTKVERNDLYVINQGHLPKWL